MMAHQRKSGKFGLGGLFCALSLLTAAAPATQAAVLALYPFSNDSLASTDTNPRSTASAITFGSGLTDTTRFTTGTDPALRVNADETVNTTFAAAATAGDFFTLNLAPDPGLRFNFQNFTVDLATSATALTTNVRLQASLDGGNTFINVDTVAGYNTTTLTTQTFDLSTANNNPAIVAGGSVVLRVLVFDSGDGNNYTAFDNITLNGTLSAVVPEPGTVTLFSLGAAAAGGMILRRRKR